MGFNTPNYTQTPNELFDVFMRRMGDAELRVVLAVVRKTFGFHKERTGDDMSLTQVQELTGLSRQGAIDGIALAVQHGYIEACGHGKRGVKRYRPVIQNDQSTGLTSTSQPSRPVDATTSQASRPTKEKEILKKNTKKKEEERDTLPIPVSYARELGMTTPEKPELHPDIQTLQANDYWKAYVRGWDGIQPALPFANVRRVLKDCADLALNGVRQEDVEALTREKLAYPKRKGDYLFTYLIGDMPGYQTRQRAAREGAHETARKDSTPPSFEEGLLTGLYSRGVTVRPADAREKTRDAKS